MNLIWVFAALAAIYGAVAGSFLDHTPYTAVAFGFLAIIFALVAYRDLASKK